MIDHENEIIFIHIPRTGGTSIENALLGSDFWNVDHRNKHASCHIAKEEYSEYWDDYFKFTFVRNPWDRHVSMLKHEKFYYGETQNFGNGKLDMTKLEQYISKFGKPPTTIEFDYRFFERNDIEKFGIIPKGIYTNYIGKEMDYIGRFENLQGDFNSITKELGIAKRELPKSGASKKRKPYTDYYDDGTRDLINSMYEFDIAKFNYTF